MPSVKRNRAKGRRSEGTFTALPHSVFRAKANHPAPTAVLSRNSLALLIDISQQFTGKNNGDLAAAPKILAPYGWKSRGTIDDAVTELLALGFLQQTRQGGRNRCGLYAITWRGIDDGPHDAKSDPVASQLWKPENAHLREKRFIQHWEKRRRGHGRYASRHEDKPSRHSDKSAILRVAK